MNCEYIKENEIHEQYLLDRLIESEKTNFLNHIKKCRTCSYELENQRLTIYSIRDFGKRDMKNEIAGQVQKLKQKRTGIDWDMLYKIAAVFFVVIITPGLVYYYSNIEKSPLSPLQRAVEITSESGAMEDELVVEEKSMKIKPIDYKKRKSKSIQKKPNADVPSEAASSKIAIVKDQPVLNQLGAGGSVSQKSSSELADMESDIILSAPPKAQTHALAAPRSISPSEVFHKPVSIVMAEESERKKSENMRASKKNRVIPVKSKKEDFSNSEMLSSHKKQNQPIRGTYYKNAYKLKYLIGEKNISIGVSYYQDELADDNEILYPDQFPVVFMDNDSVNIQMKWFISSNLLYIEPENITLKLSDNKSIEVNISEKVLYKINLDQDSTVAIRQK